MIKCDKIGVDCVYNDPVDIRAGGPEYLGFDFFVPEDETENMKKYICDCLIKYGVPLISIYDYEKCFLNENMVWDKVKIESSIKKEADYLIHESKRIRYGRR
ncbi:MAG: hypothetical protein IKR57_02480 [Bacilli bacterium]|nr:hypothetical protein [Bacilli bacterium]